MGGHFELVIDRLSLLGLTKSALYFNAAIPCNFAAKSKECLVTY